MSQLKSTNTDVSVSSLLKTPSGSVASKLAKPSTTGLINKPNSSNIPAVVSKSINTSQVTTPKSKVPLAPGIAEQYASNLLKRTSPALKSTQLTNEETTYKVGDRVWVNGIKPGVVAFIGETKFAPGEWVGVYLDAAEGKNDGNVSGVRYFTCEPLRGVFSKASKLTTDQVTDNAQSSSVNDVSSPVTSGITKLPSSLDVNTIMMEDTTGDKGSSGFCSSASTPVEHNNNILAPSSIPEVSSLMSPKAEEELIKTDEILQFSEKPAFQKSIALSKISRLPRSNQGSNVSLNQLPISESALKVGDRVVVGGTKHGTLKFLGATQFAKGAWAGVELNEPMGKNDGSVDGKRYFKCPPQFGLFAPVTKVSQASGACVKGRITMTRTGSQESISSLGSVQSSASRSGRVRLGVMPLANQGKSKTSASSQMNTSALEKALKEKEEHVEQLLVERDFERSEIARSETRAEEVERQLVQMRISSEKLLVEMEQLKCNLNELEERNIEINIQLDEERRKVEDLQFRMEEVSIDKVDWESERKRDSERIDQLNKELEEQTTHANHLDLELSLMKGFTKDNNSEIDKNLEDRLKLIEELNSEKNLVQQSEETIADLQEEIKKLSNQKVELTEEMTLVKNELVLKIDAVQSLENELLKEESLSPRKDENKLELLDKEKSLSAALSEVIELKEKLKEMEGLQEKVKLEKNQMIIDLKKQTCGINEMMEKEKTWNSLRGELEFKIISLDGKKLEILNSNEKLMSEKDELLKERDNARSELEKFKVQNSGEIEKSDQLLKEQILSLEDQISEFKIKNEEVHNMDEDHLKVISGLQNKLSDKEKEINLLAAELGYLNEKVLSAKANDDKLQNDFKEKVKQVESEKTLLDKNLEMLTNQLLMSQETEKELQRLNDALKLEVASNADCAATVNVLQDALSKKESFQEEGLVIKSKLEKLACQETATRVECEKKGMDLEELKGRFDVETQLFVQKLQAKDEEMLMLKTQNQAELDRLSEKHLNLEKDKSALSCDFEASKEDHERIKVGVSRLKEEVEELKSELEACGRDKEVKLAGEVKVREILEKEICELKEGKKKSIELVESMQDDILTLSTRSTESVEKVDEFTKLVENLKKENACLKEEMLKESEIFVKEKSKEVYDLKLQLQGELSSRESFEKEMKRTSEALQSTQSKLEDELNTNHKTNEKLKKECKENELAKCSLEKEINILKVQLDEQVRISESKLEEKNKEFYLSKSELSNNKFISLESEFIKITSELNLMKQKNDELVESETSKSSSLLKDVDDLKKKLSGVEVLQSSLRVENDEMKIKLGSSNVEVDSLKKKCEELQLVCREQEDLVNELMKSGTDKDKSCEQTSTLEVMCSNLKVELDEERIKKDEINKKLEVLQKQTSEKLSNLESEYNSSLSNREFEVNKLISKITNLHRECDESKKLLRMKSEQLSIKQSEIETSQEFHEKEKQKLETQINLLQLNQPGTSKEGRIVPGDVGDEQGSLAAQVEFLNSVIVDIQKKNESLQLQLETLDQKLCHGGHDDGDSLVAVPLNGFTPRWFCDICDMFDLHDTDDCPRQSSAYDDDDGGIPPSRHHGDPNMERPYCDICEVFGHSTEDCHDDQTF